MTMDFQVICHDTKIPMVTSVNDMDEKLMPARTCM